MKLIITIDTSNAAFDPNPAIEVARILENWAMKIGEEGHPFWQPEEIALRDVNGNTVGKVEVEGGES